MFAALDRLERRMALGMIRARDSVVALDIRPRKVPPGREGCHRRGDQLGGMCSPCELILPPL